MAANGSWDANTQSNTGPDTTEGLTTCSSSITTPNPLSKWACALVAKVTSSSSPTSTRGRLATLGKTSSVSSSPPPRSPSPNPAASHGRLQSRSSTLNSSRPNLSVLSGVEHSSSTPNVPIVTANNTGSTGDSASLAAVTLSVPPPPTQPRDLLGAIPRQNLSTESDPSSSATGTSSSGAETKRCFCGYYSEVPRGQKPGRCKFCRSKAKYLSGQRSFDAAKLFSRKQEKAKPRRAISEDRRSDGRSTEDTSASTSSATTAQSSFDRPSPSSRPAFFSTPPFLRRQERLEIDPPSPNLLTVPPPFPDVPRVSCRRDHGMRTPPAPPTSLPLRSRVLAGLQPPGMDNFDRPSEYQTHRMAHELPQYLAPPPRSGVLGRAHTDPASLYSEDHASLFHPSSPPPTYADVIKQKHLAPPSYEEALSTRAAALRLGSTPLRSHSEERTMPTRSRRGASRMLTRSSRAEDIPDIYWEQAARELDFCTCRKCQARYRQYFEEEPDPSGDAMIPIETQVLMQEVLTDGIAFCSLM